MSNSKAEDSPEGTGQSPHQSTYIKKKRYVHCKYPNKNYVYI